MSARLKRAARVVEVAEAAESAARSRSAAAERTLGAARDEARRAEARWLEAARTAATGLIRASELEQHSAFLRTLRTRADVAHKRAESALAEERKRAAEAVAAATERRKLELWRDRIANEESNEQARRERIEADELAARIFRSQSS